MAKKQEDKAAKKETKVSASKSKKTTKSKSIEEVVDHIKLLYNPQIK